MSKIGAQLGNKNGLTHGHSRNGQKSPTYHSYMAMIARCKYKHRDKKRKYVNRGITVCERWASSFENFLADMGERPSGLTLDRIDNNKGYSKENCKWSTHTEQVRNRRNTKLNYHQAFEIWCLMHQGKHYTEIGKEFSCSSSLPREIYAGRCWPDAADEARKFMESIPKKGKK